MADPRITIDVGLNATGVAKGAKDAEKALSNLEDAVGDTSREGGRDLDKIEDGLKDVQRQSAKTERSMDDIGTSGKKGFGKAKGASSEFKDEALANISEVASSFDGSLESIGDLAQGTLGGVTAALPGIGIAAAAAAAGVGFITQEFVKADEATQEAKQSAYEYGTTIAAAGQYADAAARISDLTGSVEGLKKIQDLATASGWAQKDVLTALATGDGLPALTEAFDKNAQASGLNAYRSLELDGVLRGTAQGFDLATEGARVNASALYDLASQAGTATGEVDDLGNAIVTMPDGKEVVINANTKKAYEDVDAFEKKKLPDKTQTIRLNLDTSVWDKWQPNPKTGRLAPAIQNGRQLLG